MSVERPAEGHLVVGLGNPGPRYAATRHNLGFRVVERVAGRWAAGPWRETCHSLVTHARLDGRPAVLARPQTYMNRSGEAVARLLDRFGQDLDRLVVVHDDLDLSFGRLRIRTRGGHGGHNGIRSILAALGEDAFVRLKIGIGRPVGGGTVTNHVLGPFDEDEAARLPALVDRAADAVEHIVWEGPIHAMNRMHD